MVCHCVHNNNKNISYSAPLWQISFGLFKTLEYIVYYCWNDQHYTQCANVFLYVVTLIIVLHGPLLFKQPSSLFDYHPHTMMLPPPLHVILFLLSRQQHYCCTATAVRDFAFTALQSYCYYHPFPLCSFCLLVIAATWLIHLKKISAYNIACCVATADAMSLPLHNAVATILQDWAVFLFLPLVYWNFNFWLCCCGHCHCSLCCCCIHADCCPCSSECLLLSLPVNCCLTNNIYFAVVLVLITYSAIMLLWPTNPFAAFSSISGCCNFSDCQLLLLLLLLPVHCCFCKFLFCSCLCHLGADLPTWLSLLLSAADVVPSFSVASQLIVAPVVCFLSWLIGCCYCYCCQLIVAFFQKPFI